MQKGSNELCSNLNYGLEIGPLGHINKVPHNYPPNKHVNQDWCETSRNILGKLPKTGIFIVVGAKMAQKFRPLSAISFTLPKVALMNM